MLEHEGFEPILRFIACSDTHFTSGEDCKNRILTDAMQQAYELCDRCSYKTLDAVCFAGDTVCEGIEAEFINFKNTVDRIFRPETKVKIIYGGHECGAGGEEQAINYTRKIYKTEPWTHEIINGYHFIMLSTRVNNARDTYPEYQRKWLKEQLELAREDDPKKPIFVFQHPNIRGTVFGHEDWSNPGIEAIVADYPQIIDFSGHSHYPINAPTSIYQGLFTALNTGSFDGFDGYNYYKLNPITIKENHGFASQFYFVEVDSESRVRIYPYDAISRSFFPMVWKIDSAYDPSTYLYTNKIRYSRELYPYFDNNAALELIHSENDVLTVRFPQAHIDGNEEYVKEYRYSVRRVSDNTIRVQTGEWSGFHLQPLPNTIVSNITGLDPKTEYTIEVRAVSFWEKLSPTVLKEKFTLNSLPKAEN